MKTLITNYTFNAAAKTVTFNGYSSILLSSILIITNTTNNTIIYNFADPTTGGTVNGNTITLGYNTTTMSNSDKLLVYYDDPVTTPSTTSDAQNIADQLGLLRRIVKLLESNATVDSSNRQRITIDAAPASVTTTLASTTVASSLTAQLGNSYPSSTNPYTLTSLGALVVSEFPVDQRWRIADAARNTFAAGIRSKLT